MHVDVMLTPQPLQRMDGTARALEQAGFDGILFTEAGRTAYLSAAVAAAAAPWNQAGSVSEAGSSVSRIALPPLTSTMQMSALPDSSDE